MGLCLSWMYRYYQKPRLAVELPPVADWLVLSLLAGDIAAQSIEGMLAVHLEEPEHLPLHSLAAAV